MSELLERIEVVLRTVRAFPTDQRPAAVIAPRNPAEGRALSIFLGHQEAQMLARELCDSETSRSQAISLASRIAEALQGGLVGALLTQCHPGCLRAAIQIRTPAALVEIPTEPGQALAAAVCLHLPLLADRRLFEGEELAPPTIGGSLGTFLETLDLSSLDRGAS
jgi:bifunctional DNase/RNase